MATTETRERLNDLVPGVLLGEKPTPDARRDALAVLFSVVVAVVLWFAFSMNETYSVFVNMPVEVRGLPEGQALRRPPPRSVRVQVQGVGWDLLTLSRNPPTITVRASGRSVNLVQAASESGRLPPGVSVQSVSPGLLDLDLEDRVVRAVPVRLRGAIGLGETYGYLNDPVLDPDTVRVEGAASLMRDLAFWPTEPVAFEDVRESFTAQIPLADTLAGIVIRSRNDVRLSVAVTQFTEDERWLPVRVEDIPAGVRAVQLIPDRVQATYRVPAQGDTFERVREAEDFYAYVPFAEIAQDSTGTVQPLVHLPEGLGVRDVRLNTERLQYFLVVD